MSTTFINPDGLFKANFSHVAVTTGGTLIHVSGQVAADQSGRVVGKTFEEQTHQVFENLRIALAAAGAGFEHIVKMNIYVVGLTAERLASFREIRSEFLGTHQPASTLVETGALVNPAFQLEVEVVAAL